MTRNNFSQFLGQKLGLGFLNSILGYDNCRQESKKEQRIAGPLLLFSILTYRLVVPQHDTKCENLDLLVQLKLELT